MAEKTTKAAKVPATKKVSTKAKVTGKGVMSPSKLRKMKKNLPSFFRQNYGRYKRSRVKAGWRKPRGIDNKKREKITTYGAEPNIGHRNAKAIRFLHPSGWKEVLISNVAMLSKVGEFEAIRIAASVGKKKREQIVAKANERGLKMLN